MQIGFGDKHIVHLLVRERIGVRNILVVGAIGSFALFGKHHGDIVEVAQQRGDGDSAGFDGENFVHSHAVKAAFELISHLTHNIDVDLVVEKAVNLEYVTFFDNSTCEDFFFQEIHNVPGC